jgi:hypothetical protein
VFVPAESRTKDEITGVIAIFSALRPARIEPVNNQRNFGARDKMIYREKVCL